MEIKKFLEKSKSMLIAPAGYGKTHTIALCIEQLEGKDKKCLILTHTHAGVASLKTKIENMNISKEKYSIETISSFSQKYVNAFYHGNFIPEQESQEYFTFIIEEASKLFILNPIKIILKNSYSHLIVDEYQDCTILHHSLILSLASVLPTHILGDPLQGIFNIKKQVLVDMENKKQMGNFISTENTFFLDQPYRWIKGNAINLGFSLQQIRQKLESHQMIDLSLYPSIDQRIINETDLWRPKSEYSSQIRILCNSKTDNILFIYPDSTSENIRERLVKLYGGKMCLLEAIDSKIYYKSAKAYDIMNKDNFYDILINEFKQYFSQIVINNWFNNKGVKKKLREEDKIYTEPIQRNLERLKNNISYDLLAETIILVSKLPKNKTFRSELTREICKSLRKAHIENISVYEAMKRNRNICRRLGRNIHGKCLGTTLLTKGLEFHTVVILNAHKFKDPKNFYVAITRASKHLIVFTNSSQIAPYN